MNIFPSSEPEFQTKTELARRHIQSLVLSGVYKPGDRITTREVSISLGISDTPIREAIRSLASEGWLDLQQHVGAVVEELKAEQVREISALRGVIGALSIELSAAEFTPARLAAIDENIKDSRKAMDANDTDTFIMKNYEFHDLICSRESTPWCRKFLDNMFGHMSPRRLGVTPSQERMSEALAEHIEIRDSLAKKDFAKAAALVTTHERNAGEYFLSILQMKA